jgi:hypothetical protein
MKEFIEEFIEDFGSLGKDVWDDLTPLGQWTIGIPLVIFTYVVISVMIPPLLLVAGIIHLIRLLTEKYPVLKTEMFANGIFFRNQGW